MISRIMKSYEGKPREEVVLVDNTEGAKFESAPIIKEAPIENMSDLDDPFTYGITTKGKPGAEQLEQAKEGRHALVVSLQGKTADYLKRLAYNENCTISRAIEIAIRRYQQTHQLRASDYMDAVKGGGAVTKPL